ncbi:hypothetical protein TNCV_1186921 [Trichonephila clavipes]|nr:hypothetical protein TNCV_1186921 [Trichonephila clavipes]
MAPPSPNYHTTPMGGRLSSQQILCASLPCTAVLHWCWARTRDKPATIRYLDHKATAAKIYRGDNDLAPLNLF